MLPVLLPVLLFTSSSAQPPPHPPSSTQPAPTRAARDAARQSARAATLADYRARVHAAAAPLEALAAFYERLARFEKEQPEVWEKEGFDPDEALELPGREQATDARVRGLLPAKEQVEWTGRPLEVDNSWLHAALEDYKRAGSREERVGVLRAAASRLRALEARLAELEGGGADAGVDKDAERGRLNAILRAPEFGREARQQSGNALQRLIRDFFEWVLGLLPDGPALRPGASTRATLLTQVVVFGLCLAVLAYVARRLWLRRGRGGRSLGLRRGARVVLGERLEADETSSDLLEEAERLARAGDLRGAIRKAYVALLCELGDRGLVRLAQHKTNRDYLSAVRRAAPPGLYTEMLPLTFDFEVHWYGLRDASDSDWESFRARCRRALRESGVRSQESGG
jgi:hypothetical protein